MWRCFGTLRGRCRTQPRRRFRTFRIIVLHQIHSVANFVPPHQCRVKRLQQIADGIRLLESGVKPKIIGVIGQDDGHAVVEVGKERVRGRGDDGTSFDSLPFRIAPRVPNPGKRKDGVVRHGEAERRFYFSDFAVGAFSDGKTVPAAGSIGEAALSGLLFLSRLSHDPNGGLAEVLAVVLANVFPKSVN